MPFPAVYTTRASLEQAGVPTTTWSAARLNEMIAQVGSSIDQITAGRFLCYEETFLISGDERSVIHRPDLLPVLSISDITISWNATNRKGMIYQGVLADITQPRPNVYPAVVSMLSSSYAFPSGTYALKQMPLPRLIEAVRNVFPGGVQNLSITGVCGWPELSSVKTTPFTTTTTSDLTSTSTSLNLTSVTGLKLRDVLLIGDVPLIVQGVSSLTVTIDPPAGLLTSTIASGATVVSYAAVPRGIQRVANFLCMQEVQRQTQWASGNFVDADSIAGEATDKYSYKRFSPATTVTAGAGLGLTGVTVIDQILIDHTAPAIIHFA